MWASLGTGYWVGLLLAVPAAGFLVRLFMIQHDCGRVIGVLTLTPYDFWRHSHALHHANSGNLDHRGFGDVDTLTVRGFLALSRWRQLLYRPTQSFARRRRKNDPCITIGFLYNRSCSTDCRWD